MLLVVKVKVTCSIYIAAEIAAATPTTTACTSIWWTVSVYVEVPWWQYAPSLSSLAKKTVPPDAHTKCSGCKNRVGSLFVTIVSYCHCVAAHSQQLSSSSTVPPPVAAAIYAGFRNKRTVKNKAKRMSCSCSVLSSCNCSKRGRSQRNGHYIIV